MKRLRFSLLSKDLQNNFIAALGVNPDSIKNIDEADDPKLVAALDAFEKDGTIPEEVKKTSPSVETFAKTLPSDHNQLVDYILKNTPGGNKIGTATDTELQQRITALKSQPDKMGYGGIDYDKIEVWLKNYYDTHQEDFGALGSGDRQIQDIRQIINNIKTGSPLIASTSNTVQHGQLEKDLQPLLAGSTFRTALDNPRTEQTGLEDILSKRKSTEKGQAEIGTFLDRLPGELTKNTEEFIRGEAKSGESQYRDILVPEILQNLNTRGLLTSGDLESELQRGATDIQSQVQSDYLAHLQADDQFFQTAAYNIALNNALASGQDVQAQTTAYEKAALTAQSQRFSSSQSSLNNALALSLFRKQQDRLLTAQMERDRVANERADRARKSGLVSSIGSSVGTIAGTALSIPGGVPGMVIGGQVGRLIGETATRGIT